MLVLRERSQGTHIMQPVGQLDDDDPDILRNGQDDLAKVLSLGRSGRFIDHIFDLRQPVNDPGYLFPKMKTDIVKCVIGILHHIMQQRADNGRNAHADFTGYDGCHLQRMVDIRFTAVATHILVGICRQIECTPNEFFISRLPDSGYPQQIAVFPDDLFFLYLRVCRNHISSEPFWCTKLQ